MDDRTLTAVESSNTDDLLRIIDGWCAARLWDRMLELRLHLAAAVQRGKQLWGVDEHIRYRLALEGPPELAAEMVNEGPTRFTLGPLPEVAAQNQTWADLEPRLAAGPARALVAHERLIRGDQIFGNVDPGVLEIPLSLMEWEPRYPLAVYHADRAEFPTPPIPRFSQVPASPNPQVVSDPEVEEALRFLTAPWVDQSTGRAETRAVDGTAVDAISALGVGRIGLAPVPAETALAWMGWAGASGGALGRRRGAASGRFGTWWAAAALTGLDWPPEPGELGVAVAELNWFLWDDGDPVGWHLRLAVEDPVDGIGWAIAAVDIPPSENVIEVKH